MTVSQYNICQQYNRSSNKDEGPGVLGGGAEGEAASLSTLSFSLIIAFYFAFKSFFFWVMVFYLLSYILLILPI